MTKVDHTSTSTNGPASIRDQGFEPHALPREFTWAQEHRWKTDLNGSHQHIVGSLKHDKLQLAELKKFASYLHAGAPDKDVAALGAQHLTDILKHLKPDVLNKLDPKARKELTELVSQMLYEFRGSHLPSKLREELFAAAKPLLPHSQHHLGDHLGPKQGQGPFPPVARDDTLQPK